MKRTIRATFTGFLTATALTACAPSTTVQSTTTTDGATDGKPGAPAQAFARFPDLPVPTGAKINLDQTVVFGGGEDWFGRITLSVSHSADKMFDFYKSELPAFNWQEITSVRSATSVLTYQRGARIATIQIGGRTIQGAEILVTVSPKGAPVQAPPPTNR